MSDSDPNLSSSGPAAAAILAGWWRDSCVATRFLTRVPLGRAKTPEDVIAEDEDADGEIEEGALALATRAFPLVGFAVGTAGALVLLASAGLGLSLPVAALLGLTATVAITGALHEDGLADMVDGFGGGRDREARLAIMHDSHIGAFAVLALVLSLGLRAAALAGMGSAGAAAAALIAAAAGSRAILPLVMDRMVPARMHGLAVAMGKPAKDRVLAAGALGAVLVFLFLGPAAGLAAVVAGAGAAAAVAWLADRQIGGYTGDVLGGVQQITEIAILLAAAALA